MSKPRGSVNAKQNYLARFTLKDGSYRRICPRLDEVDAEGSAASGRLVLRPGVDPVEVFCREAFGEYDVRDDPPFGLPVVRHGVFFSFDPKFVGLGKGTPIRGKRSAFRFDVVVKEEGFEKAEWAAGFEGLGRVQRITSKLRRTRTAVRKASSTPSAPLLGFAEAVGQIRRDLPRRLAAKFGGAADLLSALDARPATTLVTAGASVPPSELVGRLREEWSSVIYGLAKRFARVAQRSPSGVVARHRDEVRGVSHSSSRSSFHAVVVDLLADLAQDGFLCLLEAHRTYEPSADPRDRFDHYVASSIKRRMRECAEAGSTEIPFDNLDEFVEAGEVATRNLSPEEEVDYSTVCSSGREVLADLARKVGRAGVAKAFVATLTIPSPGGSLRVPAPSAGAVSRLASALLGKETSFEERDLTEAGVLAKRWLEIEASLSSGRRRLVQAVRFSLEDV